MIDLIRVGSFIFLGIFFLVACEEKAAVDCFGFRPEVADRPDAERIELSFVNDTKSDLCVDPTSWPSPSGKVHFAGGRIAVFVGGRRFVLKDHNTGFCVGPNCAARVAPNKRLRGFLLYDDFNLPPELRHHSKKVVYFATACRCDDAVDWMPKLRPLD